MEHADKKTFKKKSKKYLRSPNEVGRGKMTLDSMWLQYIDSQGFYEQYITDEIVNILLVIAVILCIYTFYRVFKVQKQLSKKN